jgi:AcrR family transcriptional regulator
MTSLLLTLAVRWEPGSRERLQRAAVELFSDKGYDQTTVADIAQRVEVTTRTFFRHFKDKRDVLFGGTEQLKELLVQATVSAPAELAPLEAIAEAVASLDWLSISPREDQRQRQAVIAASPELTERELIKFAALADALADGLRRRGSDDTTALLAAQAGMTVFRIAYRLWLEADTDLDLAPFIDATLADLRAVVSTQRLDT